MLKRMICTHRIGMVAIVASFLVSGCSQDRDYFQHRNNLDQGQQAYQQESYEVAISYFSEAVADAPTGPDISAGLRSLSKAYQAAGEGDKAAATLVRAMKVMKYCLERQASGRSHCPVPPWEKSYTPPFPK